MVLILGDEKTHLMSFIATCKHATGLLYPTMFVPGSKTLDFNAGLTATVSPLIRSLFSKNWLFWIKPESINFYQRLRLSWFWPKLDQGTVGRIRP